MIITNDLDLKPYNTFGISAVAKKFIEISSLDDLMLLDLKTSDKALILGGGSNLLITKPEIELVVKINLKGIEIVDDNDRNVYIKVAAGEVWHDFVMYAVDQGWGGIENLSLIPGSVGASPMQNIGAYGIEIEDSFVSLEAFHIDTKEIHQFKKEECHFGYRESVFKRELKGQYIITSVVYRLSKQPKVNVTYGAILTVLQNEKDSIPTIRQVSDAVIRIRSSKLPDITKIGCAGSFFKNPIIDKNHYSTLKDKNPGMPSYQIDVNHYKIPAGWLIEERGWKGKNYGKYGVYDKQALVLVNYGGATGKEIYDLSTNIIKDVKNKFGIELEREVNIL